MMTADEVKMMAETIHPVDWYEKYQIVRKNHGDKLPDDWEEKMILSGIVKRKLSDFCRWVQEKEKAEAEA